MAVCFWYHVKRDLSTVRYSTVTYYIVDLVGLYLKVLMFQRLALVNPLDIQMSALVTKVGSVMTEKSQK